jgi:hypothetical protein
MSDNDLIRRGDADAAIILAIGSHKTPELRAARKALDALPAATPTLALPEVRALVEKLGETLDAIEGYNRTLPDEDGLYWDRSDLITQEIMSARAALAAIKGGA